MLTCLSDGCSNEVDFDDHPYYCAACQQRSTALTLGLIAAVAVVLVILRVALA